MNTLSVKFHRVNKRIRTGWNNINVYISMAYYISIPEVLIANFFPSAFTSSIIVAAGSYGVLLYASYHLGKRNETFEEMK